MKPRPYAERWRDRSGGAGHWFVKANFLLSKGWQRDDGVESSACWRDPVTGELCTLNKGCERQRGRDAQR